MADSTFFAQILTPEGTLFEGDVTSVKVPGTNGTFQLLTRHAAILSSLEPGEVEVKQASTLQKFSISGGFVEMSQNRLTLIAESVQGE